MRFLLPVFMLAFLCLQVFAQDNKSRDISDTANTAKALLAKDADDKTALKLTDAERKQFEPLQQAMIEANQELASAADALDAAKAADVLAAAWRWKAAAAAFKTALANRGNWIATTAKAKGCDGCELNLQTGEFMKAKQ